MRALAFAFAAAGGFLAIADFAAAGGPTLIASAAHCKPTELGCDCADYAAWPGYWEDAPGRDARLAHIVARFQIGSHGWKAASVAPKRASLPVGPAASAPASEAFADETPDGVCASGAVENGVCLPTAQPARAARSVAAPASLPTGDLSASSSVDPAAKTEASAAAPAAAAGGAAATSWGGSSAKTGKGGEASGGTGGSSGGSGGSSGGSGGNGNAGSGW